MKRFPIITLLIPLVMLASACSDFLDVNEDPLAATSAEGSALFPVILANYGSNLAIETGPGQNFFIQYWSSGGSTGVFTSPERYTISPFTTGNTWVNYYASVLKNLELIIDQSLEADPQQLNQAAQAQILAAHTFYSLTVGWEDVPFSEALDVDISAPTFDEQPDILRGVVDMLDEATGWIDENSPSLPVQDEDLIYGGDMDLWRRFAQSMKLKTLFLLKSGGEDVDGQIDQVMQEELIRVPAQSALIPFFDEVGNENNTWKLLRNFSGDVNVWFFAGEPLVNLMNLYDDPRRPVYFDEVEDGGGYAGVRAGDFSYPTSTASWISLNVIRPDWSEPLTTAAEILLLEAERLVERGELEQAAEKFEQGIVASFRYFDQGPAPIPTAEQEAYLAQFDLASLSQEDAMRLVHEQQYIALFNHVPQGWTNWRRTKVPSLSPPINAQVGGGIISRYPYPPDEQAANPNAPDSPPLTEDMWFESKAD